MKIIYDENKAKRRAKLYKMNNCLITFLKGQTLISFIVFILLLFFCLFSFVFKGEGSIILCFSALFLLLFITSLFNMLLIIECNKNISWNTEYYLISQKGKILKEYLSGNYLSLTVEYSDGVVRNVKLTRWFNVEKKKNISCTEVDLTKGIIYQNYSDKQKGEQICKI